MLQMPFPPIGVLYLLVSSGLSLPLSPSKVRRRGAAAAEIGARPSRAPADPVSAIPASLHDPKMSDQLVWQLVKKNHSFLVKRDGVQFSREPCNLTNTNSYKFSGLRSKAVGLSETADKKVAFTIRTPKAASKPARNNQQHKLSRSMRRATKAVEYQTATRADLRKAAQARLAALNASINARSKKIE